MNKIEKISVARVVSDLITADSVIDSREMEIFSLVKEAYHLTEECLCDARHITFSEAVNTLSLMDREDKEALLEVFRKITLADSMCNKDEALLMISLIYSLEGEYDTEMLHVRVPQQGLQIENSQVIYVESQFVKETNKTISENYHQIENALRLAGFDFAYIPHIANTYKNTQTRLFNDVIRFLSPNIEESASEEIQERISSMTTAGFCQDQLCRKLCFKSLSTTEPSLLIKVGETVSEEKIFANFMKMVIGDDILNEIKQFIYKFTSMMNSEYSILRNIYNSTDKFLYSGVYKQILDLFLMKEEATSYILLDTVRQKIILPEIKEELKITTSEKALYALILAESITGGMNMNPPASAKQMQLHKEKQKKLMAKYRKIYGCFGGNKENTPNIFDSTIRNPKISKINKCVMGLANKLSHIDEYLIQRTQEGLYRISLDNSMIYCNDDVAIPWMQSDLWRQVISM